MKNNTWPELLNANIANLSIGQGDTQVTPLQSEAMSIVATAAPLPDAIVQRCNQSMRDRYGL